MLPVCTLLYLDLAHIAQHVHNERTGNNLAQSGVLAWAHAATLPAPDGKRCQDGPRMFIFFPENIYNHYFQSLQVDLRAILR